MSKALDDYMLEQVGLALQSTAKVLVAHQKDLVSISEMVHQLAQTLQHVAVKVSRLEKRLDVFEN